MPPPPRRTRASETTRLLSDSYELESDYGADASTMSAPSIIPQRWRRRFPIFQSAIDCA